MTDSAHQSLIEILGAAQQFLDEGEYEKVVIQANRLLTVAAVWLKSSVGANVAVALRLAGQDMAIASSIDCKLDISQKQDLERLIAGYTDLVAKESTDSSAPWTLLAHFKQEFWARSRASVEGRTYTQNEQIVSEALRWAHDSLLENLALLHQNRGSPFSGVANEIDWAIRSFGSTPRQTASYAILCSLAWQSEYERWKSSGASTEKTKQESNSRFEDLAKRLIELVYPTDENWDAISGAIAEISRMWRSDFSTFFDYFVAQQQRPPTESVVQGEEEEKPSRRGFRKSRKGRDS